jgi:UDP-N-acetylmuramoylalanine--D-glutamate ligase
MTLLDIKGKQVVIFGLARSGLAAARALTNLGALVTITELNRADEFKPVLLDEVRGLGARLVCGGHPDSLLEGTSALVLSPGVPDTLAVIAKARQLGLPVWSEMELAFRLSRSPWVAITGTNGKTTTTTLVAELFKAAGRPFLLGGNIGEALCDKVTTVNMGTTVVAEVSSFQLDDVETFRPRVAVVTNITPDHLNRYQGMAEYIASKARIFKNQRAGDTLVLNAMDPVVATYARECQAQVLWFTRQDEPQDGAWVRQGRVKLKLPGAGEQDVMAESEIGIRGPHNLENALAALLAGAASGLPLEAMARALREFKGVEHRLEPCGEIKGVRFINDSKGTNVDSVDKALQSFDGPIHLILGGRDKAGDFTALSTLISKNVAALYLIGEAADKIDSQVGKLKPSRRVKDLREAVTVALRAARPGDYVVLSPGCASFDMFENYEQRGRIFKEEVAKLKQES